MIERTLHPIPNWMKLDTRPIDRGEWQPYGYGYSRPVGRRELWRPATRAIIRRDRGKFRNFEMVALYPNAYFVSDHGRVYSRLTGQIISKRRYHKRHTKLNLLTANENITEVYRYRLVLINFIEPPKKLRNIVFYLMNTVNHRDGNPWNDSIDNLQFTPNEINVEHQNKVIRSKKQDGGKR